MTTNTHECPTCKNIYSGRVCIPCFNQAKSFNQKAFLKEYTNDKKYEISKTKYRNSPDPKYALSPTADLRPDSRFRKKEEKRQEQEKPTLKIFEIQVWEEAIVGLGNLSGKAARRRKDVIIMLSEDLESVGNQVYEIYGYEDLGFTVEIKEVEGPFTNGSVLSSWG